MSEAARSSQLCQINAKMTTEWQKIWCGGKDWMKLRQQVMPCAVKRCMLVGREYFFDHFTAGTDRGLGGLVILKSSGPSCAPCATGWRS
jgi:hypothetical protein